MGQRHQTGRTGEALACSFLELSGYSLLATNWRHRGRELDIVALLGSTMVVVEVKTRRGSASTRPERAVDLRKQRHLAAAAEAFRAEHGWEGACRFDILAIGLLGDRPTISHFQDAFYPNPTDEL